MDGKRETYKVTQLRNGRVKITARFYFKTFPPHPMCHRPHRIRGGGPAVASHQLSGLGRSPPAEIYFVFGGFLYQWVSHPTARSALRDGLVLLAALSLSALMEESPTAVSVPDQQ